MMLKTLSICVVSEDGHELIPAREERGLGEECKRVFEPFLFRCRISYFAKQNAPPRKNVLPLSLPPIRACPP